MTEISDQEAQRVIYGKLVSRGTMLQAAIFALEHAANDSGINDCTRTKLVRLCTEAREISRENTNLIHYWRTDE